MSPPLLEVAGLSKSWGGVDAVREVSFALRAGEITALIGANGAGKSTCFNMLTGQVRPDRGAIRVDGHPVAGRSPGEIWALGIGRTFQVATPFRSMSVRENVQVGLLSASRRLLRPGTWAGRHLTREAEAILDLVHLGTQAGRPCGELAYGELKQLDLALALTNAPRLLLMDEPTAGMTPSERAAAMRSVATLARERNVAVLFTEHDVDIVFEHAERVMVMDRGRLIADADPDTVRRDPAVRAAYLGEASPGGAGRA